MGDSEGTRKSMRNREKRKIIKIKIKIKIKRKRRCPDAYVFSVYTGGGGSSVRGP
jgi:hypothetical protein